MSTHAKANGILQASCPPMMAPIVHIGDVDFAMLDVYMIARLEGICRAGGDKVEQVVMEHTLEYRATMTVNCALDGKVLSVLGFVK